MGLIQEFGVVACLAVKDGKYLFIEESKPGREGKFNFPAGHIDGHETLLQAVVREAKEESGYDVSPVGIVGVYQTIDNNPNDDINISIPVFLCEVTGGQARPTPEHPTVNWFTKVEFNKLWQSGKIFNRNAQITIEDFEERGSLSLDYLRILDFRSRQ